MKEQNFLVEASSLPQFVEALTENDLTNEIIGQTEDGEIIISVDYKDEEDISFLFELAETVSEEDLEEMEIDD